MTNNEYTITIGDYTDFNQPDIILNLPREILAGVDLNTAKADNIILDHFQLDRHSYDVIEII